jgi:hypothetical protein
MAVAVNEIFGARSCSIPANGRVEATRKFMVYDDAGTDLLASVALADPNVPKYGDVHPEFDDSRVRSFSVASVSDTESAKEITVKYQQTAPATGGGSYSAASTSSKSMFVDIWRIGATLPGSVDIPRRSDIGGTKVDTGGDPVSYAVYQQSLTLRSPYNNPPDFATINAMLNRRNRGNWNGWPAGMVLYLGAEASVTSGNYWTVSHRFLADGLYHLRQLARKNDAEKVVGEETTDDDGNKETQAKTVYWVQMFRDTGNFDLLGINPGGPLVSPLGFNYA